MASSPTREEIAKLASSPAHEARLLCRHNLVETTSGLAGDYVQANLVILFQPIYQVAVRDSVGRFPLTAAGWLAEVSGAKP